MRLIAAVPVMAVALLSAATTGKVESIHATDLQGKPVTIQTAGKVTAVIFVSTQCPVSNAYNDRMKALYKDYKDKGVQLVFLNANSTEPAANVAAHAKSEGFEFAVYKDDNNVEADRFGAEFTPHVFVIGKDSQLIYRGGIDDSRNPANITKNYLQESLDAAVAGKPQPVAETKAFGCSIKRAKKSS